MSYTEEELLASGLHKKQGLTEEQQAQLRELEEKIRALPPNTLRNADGTAYSAGHDRAIDEQKVKAHHYAMAFTQKLSKDLLHGNTMRLFDKWSLDDISLLEHEIKEHLEEFALVILKEAER